MCMFCIAKHLLSVCFFLITYKFSKVHNIHIEAQYISKRNIITTCVLLLYACIMFCNILYGIENSFDKAIEIKLKCINIVVYILFIFGILVLAPKSKKLIDACQSTTQLLVISNLFGKPLLTKNDCKTVMNSSRTYKRFTVCLMVYFLIVALIHFYVSNFQLNVFMPLFSAYIYVLGLFQLMVSLKIHLICLRNIHYYLKHASTEDTVKLLLKLYSATVDNFSYVFKFYVDFYLIVTPSAVFVFIVFAGLVLDLFLLLEDWQIYTMELINAFSMCAVCSIASYITLIVCYIISNKVSFLS